MDIARECPTRRGGPDKAAVTLRLGSLPMHRLRVAAAQINATVGDLAGNAARILAASRPPRPRAPTSSPSPSWPSPATRPRTSCCGRPSWPRPSEALEKIAARTGQTVAVVGFPQAERDLYNAAAVCAGGSVRGVYRK